MVESILSIFVKNSQLSLGKKRPSGNLNFEESLNKQEKLMQKNNPKSFDVGAQNKEVERHTEYNCKRESEVYRVDESEPEDSKPEELLDEEDVVVVPQLQVRPALEEIADILKLDTAAVEKIKKLMKGGDIPALEKKLTQIVAALGEESLKDVKKLLTNLQKALKGDDQKSIKSAIAKVLKSEVGSTHIKADKPGIVKDDFKLKVETQESEKSVKQEDFGEMGKSIKKFTVKTDHASEAKLFNENYKMKGEDSKQVKLAQVEIAPEFSQKQGKGGFGKDSFGKKEGAPEFIKKMKSALSMKSGEKAEGVSTFEAPPAKTTAGTKVSFVNKMVNGKFVQQMVEKIQNMVSQRTTISGSVDFKSVDFGELKLAAEVTGSRLVVKLSSTGQSVNNEILSMKGDLMSELKSLGFDDVELDFGNDPRNSNGNNPFEEEIEKRLQKDAVKLPGDYLADLGKIDEWLKGFEEVG